MKTSLQRWFLAASLSLSLGTYMEAQNGKTARTNAYMAFSTYETTMDVAELKKAREAIDMAIGDPAVTADPKTWKYRGLIYTKVAADANLRTQHPEAAVEAFTAYMKAIELERAKLKEKGKPESKIPTKSEYTAGLSEVSSMLYNSGADLFTAEKYDKAYECFASILRIRPETAFFTGDKPVDFKFKEEDAARLAGVAAIKNNQLDAAEKLLTPLLEKGTMDEESAVSLYNTLANGLYNGGQKEKGKQVLANGMKKYPTNINLMIAEINFGLVEGKLAEMEEKLKKASAAAPDNVELMFVTGNMYDELFRKNLAAGDIKTAEDYFNKAIEWYQKGLKKDPKHYNSAYSLGAIHVNFSNTFVEKMNNITNAKSADYVAAEKRYRELLDGGLSFLMIAEEINPDEIGVLTALKEVYIRRGDMENFEKYKKRVQELQNKQ